jgi:DNA-binding NarL/FixJ family response regulator
VGTDILAMFSKLTAQERKILDLLVEDACSNLHISLELGISERTVKRHLWNMLNKTGCRTRLDLVTKAWKERAARDRFSVDCPHCGGAVKISCAAS